MKNSLFLETVSLERLNKGSLSNFPLQNVESTGNYINFIEILNYITDKSNKI